MFWLTIEFLLKGYNIFEIQMGESLLQLSSTTQWTGADHTAQTHSVKLFILLILVKKTQLAWLPIQKYLFSGRVSSVFPLCFGCRTTASWGFSLLKTRSNKGTVSLDKWQPRWDYTTSTILVCRVNTQYYRPVLSSNRKCSNSSPTNSLATCSSHLQWQRLVKNTEDHILVLHYALNKAETAALFTCTQITRIKA